MIESFKLSHFKLCSLSRQVRVLLNALKIPYESKQRDITALSSIERISPTLLIGNKLVLNGFWSIYSYLIETHQHYLLPNSLEEKINFFSDLELINGKFYYEVIHVLLVKTFTNQIVIDHTALRSMEQKLQTYLVFFNRVLEQNDGFFYAKKSILDIALAAHISTLDYLNYVTFKDYPFIYRWYLVMKSEPAFREILLDIVTPITPPARYTQIDFDA